MSPPWHFTTPLDLLDHWQTLLAGALALLAGLGTVWATIRSANRQIAAARLDADEEIAASRAQTVAAEWQTATTIRLERLRAQNEHGDESVAAALEMQSAVQRCTSAIEGKRAEEIWATYNAAWDRQTTFRAAYAVARRYYANLPAGGVPAEVDALLYQLRDVAIPVAAGGEPNSAELNRIVTDLRNIVEHFESQLGSARVMDDERAEPSEPAEPEPRRSWLRYWFGWPGG
jgi:hypothetical protein